MFLFVTKWELPLFSKQQVCCCQWGAPHRNFLVSRRRAPSPHLSSGSRRNFHPGEKQNSLLAAAWRKHATSDGKTSMGMLLWPNSTEANCLLGIVFCSMRNFYRRNGWPNFALERAKRVSIIFESNLNTDFSTKNICKSFQLFSASYKFFWISFKCKQFMI